MLKRALKVFMLVVVFFPQAIAMKYDRNAAVNDAEEHFCGNTAAIDAGLLNCQRYVFRANLAGGLRVPEKRISRKDWPKDCKRPEFPITEDEFMLGYRYLDYLRMRLKCPYAEWTAPQLPATPDDIEERLGHRLCPGDDVFFEWNNDTGHCVIVVDTSPDDIQFKGQNDPDPWSEYNRSLFDFINKNRNKIRRLAVAHIPDSIGGCKAPQYIVRNDSNVGIVFGGPPPSDAGRIFHQWHCCWHENLGGTWPWSDNPSAYACLSWSEARGTTIDSLISPRMNLAGCSLVVFRQKAISTLQRGVIEIRGSTDNGATWPYFIGTDTTTEASLPWATNQRNVRIAWNYRGPVQFGRYWCIDDIEIWARPTRRHDVSVSGVVYPSGILTPGKIVIPSVFVWNHGLQTESVAVTMNFGGYSDSKWVKLYPFNDTLLEFASWNAVPGTYTATCFTSLDNDECRANDTARLTFRVVADTWVRMVPVYGGGGMGTGGCLATTDSNNIFSVIGRNNFFARYLVRENLWKNRTATPAEFSRGAGLAYAGGDYIYALRGGGHRSFYRYSISQNRWSALGDAPDKIGDGGALAWAGGDYLYCLRGGAKKDFYRYSISNKTWQVLNQIPVKVQGGGALVWTGGDYLYALAGNNSLYFYRYQISTNQWSPMAQVPQNVNHGGALAYNPNTGKIYAFCGNNSNYFYCYNISTNSWSLRRSAPGKVKSGGCLAYCDYSIFGALGMGSNDDFWRYSPPVGGFGFEEERGEEVEVSPTMVSLGSGLGPGLDAGELLTYSPFDKFNPRFSPDGNFIVYIQEDTTRDCFAPYKISAYGVIPETPLTDETDSTTYEKPVWSPDGNWIGTAGENGLFKISSDGAVRLQLTQGLVADVRFGADGNWLFYSKWDSAQGEHQLFKVRSDGTEETPILPENNGYLQPRPINDSEFVCVKLKDEVYQLCKVKGNSELWLTSDYMHNINPDVSPDGEWVTYQKLDESGFWQVYRMRTDGSDEICISDGSCPAETPVFSPDGMFIAYTKWPVDLTGSYEFSKICYRDASALGTEVNLTQADAVRRNPAWSPDCAYIVYEQETSSGTFGPKQTPRRIRQLARVRTGLKFSGGAESALLPRRFELFQNRPNPFSRTTLIRYAVPYYCRVELLIYDISGRIVNRLVQAEQKPGYYTVNWRGVDSKGNRLPAGAYYYILKADGKTLKRRMLLIR